MSITQAPTPVKEDVRPVRLYTPVQYACRRGPLHMSGEAIQHTVAVAPLFVLLPPVGEPLPRRSS